MKMLRDVEAVVAEMYESIMVSPKRQRRLRSKTFWGDFGFKKRSKQRIAHVKEALQDLHISTNIPPEAFGTEDEGEWIVLTHIGDHTPSTSADLDRTAQIHVPSDDWFDLMVIRQFESEREVEYNFVLPLVEELGYRESDQSIGHGLVTHQGSKKIKTEADVVLFDGEDRSPDNALVVIEAKSPTRKLTTDHTGQARSYAITLLTPLYVVTNGEEVRVSEFRMGLGADAQVLRFTRAELKERWSELYAVLNKAATRARKARNLRILAAEQEPAATQ
jgi:hypothetical protein